VTEDTASAPAAEPAPQPAPQAAETLTEAEPPAAPVETGLAVETPPAAPAPAEAAAPPDAPAALEPPPAAADAPPAAAEPAPIVVAEAPVAETEPAPATDPEPAPELAEALPETAPDAGTAPDANPEPSLADAGTEAAPAADEPAAEPPAAAPLPQTDGMAPDTDEPALPGTEVMPEVPDPGLLPAEEDPESSNSTFKPAPGLGDSEGVIVGRLPRIGDAPAEEPPAIAEAEPPEADIPPIRQFAAPFENLDAKPVLALVLIDPGTADLDPATLAALPFPVSFALDPTTPATAERAAIYRAAGKEVVMLATGIAEGAQASDIEVAFQSMAQGLPEAVAVMDLADPVFQDRRPLASLVVPVVGAQGRGLLTWDRGLNAADQVARRDDVPASVLFRDLDSAGSDSAAIRRVLDRAVFKAGQDGRVAVAGTATPELVAALLEWSVEGRAATVALGPVTAVMTVE
jgi:polysaccharide deacetylase 2 family uncharacterized protein YibQ